MGTTRWMGEMFAVAAALAVVGACQTKPVSERAARPTGDKASERVEEATRNEDSRGGANEGMRGARVAKLEVTSKIHWEEDAAVLAVVFSPEDGVEGLVLDAGEEIGGARLALLFHDVSERETLYSVEFRDHDWWDFAVEDVRLSGSGWQGGVGSFSCCLTPVVGGNGTETSTVTIEWAKASPRFSDERPEVIGRGAWRVVAVSTEQQPDGAFLQFGPVFGDAPRVLRRVDTGGTVLRIRQLAASRCVFGFVALPLATRAGATHGVLLSLQRGVGQPSTLACVDPMSLEFLWEWPASIAAPAGWLFDMQPASDVDRRGVDDAIVCWKETVENGVLFPSSLACVSGEDGAVLWRVDDVPGRLVWVSPVVDLDRDGCPELLAGTHKIGVEGDVGELYLFDGRTGALLESPRVEELRRGFGPNPFCAAQNVRVDAERSTLAITDAVGDLLVLTLGRAD